ncbi:hypothetical protein ThimaDRAFT_1772 [Thiocapsa marina 5811]|uniref:Uncharacterized protein n=2 Tax=Thiocapsa marina TaxID=244573 RepID=F9UA20_9GAMM|nr:hypothetical protein ThimaDRAFT_1772 [Thiocapsa marina 5811]
MSPEDLISKWQGVTPDGRAACPGALAVLNVEERMTDLIRLPWSETRSRAVGEANKILDALKASPTTARAKAKFVPATDGLDPDAEDLSPGETIACDYPK